MSRSLNVLAGVVALAAAGSAYAQTRGVTKDEIKLGQTMAYSGPVSAFSPLGKGEVGYFKMLNEKGGINGRKINPRRRLCAAEDRRADPPPG